MVLQLLMWMLLLESHVFTCEELKRLLTKIMIIKNVFYWFLKNKKIKKKKKKKKGGGEKESLLLKFHECEPKFWH